MREHDGRDRHGVGSQVGEVDPLAADVGDVLRHLVEGVFPLAPVEPVPPVVDEGSEDRLVDAGRPRLRRHRRAVPGLPQALGQVGELGVGDLDGEGDGCGRGHGHGPTSWPP